MGHGNEPGPDRVPDYSLDRRDRLVVRVEYDVFAALVFKPGDMTRYEFIVADYPEPGYCYVAGSPGVSLVVVSRQEVADCYRRLIDCVGKHTALQGRALEDWYVSHLREQVRCNPWTAWALVQCLGEYWRVAP